MDYLCSRQESAMLGIIKLPHETHLGIRQARFMHFCFAHGISLFLAIFRPSSQNQSSSCHIGERATKEKNRGHFKEEVSLILLNLKHYLRLEVQ